MLTILLALCLCIGALYMAYLILRESFRLTFYKTKARAILNQSVKTQYGFYFKHKYDKSESFYRTILSEATPFLHKYTRALDVGCGPGRLVFEYEKLGVAKSTGLDNSKQYIRYCNYLKSHTPDFSFEIPKNSASEFLCKDILKNQFAENSADFISCINVFDRVKNPAELFTALHATLDTNGILLITTPYDWRFSLAPKNLHVSDMKNVFNSNDWSIEKEIRDIPYAIPISKIRDRTYATHMLILKKK